MSKDVIKGLKPEVVWERFFEITQVPRPSKKEEKVRTYLRNFAKTNNVKFNEDKVGNIVMFVPASEGLENAPTVVLQSHVDMVCEKNKEKKFDFENDPIELLKDGSWITANGTTLGADNGIGMAFALATVTDTSVKHGPLELLFTIDEETGLTGANNLKPGFIKGKYLLNIDSEEEGTFYVGCSGGVDTLGIFDIKYKKAQKYFVAYEMMVTGLKGGHSGLDIHQGRANAIKLLGLLLNKLDNKKIKFKLANIKGGSLRNAIPREAETIIVLNQKNVKLVEKIIQEYIKDCKNEYQKTDQDIQIEFNKIKKSPKKVFSNKFTQKLIKCILAMPHGVIAMSQTMKDLVETSTNLATIIEEKGKLKIGTSQRSSIESAKKNLSEVIKSVFELCGASVIRGDGYPGWQPNLNSELLKFSMATYQNLYNKKPKVKAIHAGLECGILGSKSEGLDMLSFGPTIQGAHSPDEKLNIADVEKIYDFVKVLLKDLASKK
ncbi:MAG: aminoacyl-histidine dipeptidase [Ignavibacteriales bacterium]|nr:aminoacyl-histidine dipeptidase [Ignavibacteriales bacterium]